MKKKSLRDLGRMVRKLNEDPFSTASYTYKVQNKKKTYLYCYDVNSSNEYDLICDIIRREGFVIVKRHPNGSSSSKLIVLETPHVGDRRSPRSHRVTARQ